MYLIELEIHKKETNFVMNFGDKKNKKKTQIRRPKNNVMSYS